VGLLYGGRSGEHEVSVRSARSVAGALDRDAFELVALGVAPDGRWYSTESGEVPGAAVVGPGQGAAVTPAGDSGRLHLLSCDSGTTVAEVDVVFPVLHGPGGEDGTVQGLCEVFGVPYVGAGVMGSAIGMDKDVHKRLLRDAGIPVVRFEAVYRDEWVANAERVRERLAALGERVFVKPANLGSSVGISKVHDPAELGPALDTAFRHDRKAVVEVALDAREIECAVLGNRDPHASVLGEIAPGEEFYSYDDKYAAGSAAHLLIPAPLDEELSDRIRGLAVRGYRVLGLRGMARVDFFLERASGHVYLNEPNTLPGFTSISMYPKLWQASGLPYSALISKLIELALAWQRDGRTG